MNWHTCRAFQMFVTNQPQSRISRMQVLSWGATVVWFGIWTCLHTGVYAIDSICRLIPVAYLICKLAFCRQTSGSQYNTYTCAYIILYHYILMFRSHADQAMYSIWYQIVSKFLSTEIQPWCDLDWNQGLRRFRRIVVASWQIRSSAVNSEKLFKICLMSKGTMETCKKCLYMSLNFHLLSHGEDTFLKFMSFYRSRTTNFSGPKPTQKDGFGKVSSSLGSAVGGALQQLGAQGLLRLCTSRCFGMLG